MSENRIVVSVQLSLDGRTAGPAGELDWFAVKDELHEHFVTEHSQAGAFMYGRRTYEGMAAYWPTADQDPDNDPWLIEYSKVWKSMPKAVFSRTLTSAEWDTTVLRDVAALDAFRARATGDLYLLGSGRMITELTAAELVDEFQLYVHPSVLGRGPSLLEGLSRRLDLELVDSQTFDRAVTKLTYHRAQ
ncbi:dihydrofolate reductase family protein [Kribbella sp. NPDC059898]|uniref:dihydrofolate reductase family protein n=1 Tax=Kribbella sp. NPDC059898 TaxID=3346995 RepID=UPI003659F381